MGNLLSTCDFPLLVHQIVLLAGNHFHPLFLFVLNSNTSKIVHNKTNPKPKTFHLHMISSNISYLNTFVESSGNQDISSSDKQIQNLFSGILLFKKSLEDMFPLNTALTKYGIPSFK